MSIKTIVVSLFLWVVCSCLSAENAINELLQLEKDFQNAIVKNDSTAIGQFLADDWIVVDPQGQIIDKAKFLAIIKSGTLTHDQMNLEMPRIRLYENTAVITGRASSSGKYLGTQFKTLEQSTDVFTKIDGRWRCVLTHLTSLNEEAVVKTRAEAEGTSAPH